MAVLCPDVLDGIVVGHSRQCGAIGESDDPILHGRGEALVLMALSDNLDELAITLIDIRSKAAKHLVVADVGSELRSLPLQGDAFGGRLDGLQVSRNVCAHALQIAVGVEPNVDFVGARSEPDIVAAVGGSYFNACAFLKCFPQLADSAYRVPHLSQFTGVLYC
jgi:hypothetical protein